MHILFPGRHHILTDFQFKYLYRIINNGLQSEPDVDGKALNFDGPVDSIIYAVTSANHSNTRRNPVPFYLRAMALAEFQQELGVPGYIFPIDDIGYQEDFARYTLKKIRHESEHVFELNPENTVVACSSPVRHMYAALGFRILPVELKDPQTEKLHTQSPWDLVELIGERGDDWSADPTIFNRVHPASYRIWHRYRLGARVERLFSDKMLGADGDLTESRDYNSYVRQMDDIARLKFDQTRPFLQRGRIGDIGCAVGTWLEYASHDPELRESDLIGIEAAFHLYRICLQRKENGVFGNPNVFFAQRNAVTGLCFLQGSMNTIHTSSLTHEIESYGSREDLLQFIRHRYTELKEGGVWINRDVVGPEEPDREIWLRLNDRDGRNYDFEANLDDREELAKYLRGLSTRARFLRFARDFRREEGSEFKFEWQQKEDLEYAVMSLRHAMEFISRKDYLNSWESEMHETFCFWTYEDYVQACKEVGFRVVSGSHAYTNNWLVHNRFQGKADLYEEVDSELRKMDYPQTHMLLVVRK